MHLFPLGKNKGTKEYRRGWPPSKKRQFHPVSTPRRIQKPQGQEHVHVPLVRRSGRTNSQKQKKHVKPTPGECWPMPPQQGRRTSWQRGLKVDPEAPSPSELCVHVTSFGERICGDVIKFRVINPDYTEIRTVLGPKSDDK